MTTAPTAPTAAWHIWLGLAIVYVVWGSTYLAIAYVVQTLPPLLGAAGRFLVAGLLLVGWVALRNGFAAVRVSRDQLASCAVVGAALLLGGNGLVMIAERDVPSGLTALLIGAVPLWVVVYRVLAGERISRVALTGIVVGFLGVAVLVASRGLSGDVPLLGFVLLIGASASWAAGSTVSRALPLPSHQLLSTGLQMVCGGVALLVSGLALGELGGFRPEQASTESLLALGYLVIFGSLVAFTAYTWLLQHAPVSQVATYAYVNPVVAVALGAIFLGESISVPLVFGAVLVIASVALVVWRDAGHRPAGAEREEAPATGSPVLSERGS